MNDQMYLYLNLLNYIELWEGKIKEAQTQSDYIYAQGALYALKQLKAKFEI